MADLTDTVQIDGLVHPRNIIESAFKDRCEPLISAEKLVKQYLFGIPLRSAVDPKQVMTLDDIEGLIVNAISQIETDFSFVVFESLESARLPYDDNAFKSFGYMKLPHRPVWGVKSLSIRNLQGDRFYTVPNEWIDVGRLVMGQLNIIPLSPANATFAYTALDNGGGPGSFTFLTYLSRLGWIPSYWTVEYFTGFPDNCFPRSLNRLIGMTVAIEVLSLLGATNAKTTSRSIGVDGLSQSTSGPGPNLYDGRIKQLEADRQKLGQRFKAKFGQRMSAGTL